MKALVISQLILLPALLLQYGFVNAESCKSQEISLHILGSGGPELTDSRASSSYLLMQNNKARILIDVGPGSSAAFDRQGVNFNDVSAILLTHLHVDHSNDLAAYIKGSYFTNRQENLMLFGPDRNELMPSTSDFIERLFGINGLYPYLNEYISGNKPSDYIIKVTDVPLIKGSIQSYQISSDIVAEATFVHHGPVAALAWRINIAGCSITFSGDMSNQYDALQTLSDSSDILVAHYAIPEHASRVAKSLHMSPSEIASIARQSKVKKLVLSHFMKRSLKQLDQSLNLISNIFTGQIVLAEDGQTIFP